MSTLIQMRRDTTANWASADPVLAAAEFGFDTDLGTLKVGDGILAWSALPGFAPYVQATDFGVVADGTTDDTTELQAAIDYAYGLGGATVMLPDGVILVSAQITVPEHVWLVGESPGGWENYGTVNAGTTIRLKSSSGLSASDAIVRFQYEGSLTSERRHQGGMSGVAVDGNRSTNTSNRGISAAGVRFVHFERVHVFRCGSHGFYAETDVTATSELSFEACFSGFNGGSGYALYGGDATLTGVVAGVNDLDGIYCGLAATVITGASCWNNHRDGLALANSAAMQFVNVVGGQFYDNDRAGITVESGIAQGAMIVGASCHGNGRDAATYTSATDRVGIRVVGAVTAAQLGIFDVATGNRSAETYQQYGVSLQNAAAVVESDGVWGTNTTSLWYLAAGAVYQQGNVGLTLPGVDNSHDMGRSGRRWRSIVGMRHTVYLNASDAQPRVQLGSLTAGAELSFGPGGSTAPDVQIIRGAADRLDMATGDSFKIEGAWNGGRLMLGAYHLWVDATGALRIKSGAPASDTDGTVVGTQT